MLNPLKVILFYTLIICTACNSDNSVSNSGIAEQEEGYSAKISLPAGEMLAGFENMLAPTFFNIATFKEAPGLQAIVLGPRIKSGKSIRLNPLAHFRYRKETIPVGYLVSLPVDIELHSEVIDYHAFMSLHNELTSSIESWFRSQCGITNCSDYTWENPHKVLLELEANNNSQQ